MGVLGQPSASAIGRGMAMTRGVSMNGLAAGAMAAWPFWRSFSFRMAAHELAAGDHTTGCGPIDGTSDHPSASCCMAVPDETFCTRTKVQPPSFDSLAALN